MPAAVPATLRGHAGPWPLGYLYVDTEYCGRRHVYLRGEDARWSRWSTHDRDRLQSAAILTAVLPNCSMRTGRFPGPASRSQPPCSWACRGGVAFALGLGVVVLIVWLWRRERFADCSRTLLPHPAEDALDTEQREQLYRAMAFRFPKADVVEDMSWNPGAL
ncbi:hypothetical protein ACIRJM_03430 [Streptomyces sp. NPDC102405]|uniref:hypothetical protein n=1 Tax=Streptomyces sp. NPDC102405 TaxID=3366170 RepID=UPI003820E557